MINHYEAAVSAAFGRDNVADIAVYDLPTIDGRQGAWVEVIYRGLSGGPTVEVLRRVMDSVGEVACASDARPVVSFICEDDLVLMAAE